MQSPRPIAVALWLSYLGCALLPRARSAPGVWSAICLTGAIFAVVLALIGRTARRTGQALVVESWVRSPHYVQAAVQGALFAYWASYWAPAVAQLQLLVAQLIFAYLLELCIGLGRYRTFRLGFAPFPIVISINFLLWFVDSLFGLQLAVIGLAYLSRELLRWRRQGQSVHIFNPSGFGLAIAAYLVVACRADHQTRGLEVTRALELLPHGCEAVFCMGLVVQALFKTVLLTAPAALSTWAFGGVYRRLTGRYLYGVPVAFPVAVFLGMNLLITDPASSPRRAPAKAVFGALYGGGVAVSYLLLSSLTVTPSSESPGFIVDYFDKLMVVPLLNLLVQPLDRLASRLEQRFARRAADVQAAAPSGREQPLGDLSKRWNMLLMAGWSATFWFALRPG